LNQDSSVITVQDNDKFEKMEESMKAMQKRLTELQQEQVNQTMGPRDLVNYMESSNSNLIDKLASQSKRARSPDRKPEEPKLLEKTLELKDDAHTVLQKEYRENWRQINRNPELWWSQEIYPIEVEPNLRGSVYLEHLIPMTLNEKALSWLHSSSKRIDVKMMAHKNSTTAKKSKKEMLNIQTSESNDGTMSVEASIPWEESSDVFEIIEAVMNLVAAEHMIRPWSYQAINIMRSLHEVKYFCHVVKTARDQKDLCETFVNEVLSKNVTRSMTGKPPMTITECLDLASIVCARNGGQMADLYRRIDPYSAFRATKSKEEEISRLSTLLYQANQKLRNNQHPPRGNGGGAREVAPGGGYNGGRQRGAIAGGGRGGGAQRPPGEIDSQDPAYTAIKRTLCKFFNEKRGCDRPDSCSRLHKCSRRLGPGQACLMDHSFHNHSA
jgi:hypothetical protein